MKRYKKSELLQITGILEETNESLMKQFNQISQEELVDIMTQCQDIAIQAGTYIESLEPKIGRISTDIVKLLEQYCELIYQISIGFPDKTNCFNLVSNVKHLLKKLKSLLQNKYKDRKEVVFLPYKASMWDSLESVWKSADDDGETDAYVIPIPYYDKNSDGSFGMMHYEGDMYPDYVPITSWEEYSFEERRPDIIFIHNPYDETNKVTSVHPFFYSKNLKQYTDKLVYIPYFILDEVNINDELEIQNIEHFCLLPAVIHANKVIVQSENMRQIYIKVLVKNTGEKTRQYWEDKIYGTGSPKIDRLAYVRKTDLDIPEEWLKIIRKPDGSWKKIIFYNVSVAALLNTKEQMIIKIKDVLKVFKENSGEIALLFRPHPLMRETIKAMREELLEEYDEIISTYRQENWGIYDDTPDIDRAIILSDAYYGTNSSVVPMYKATKKPIMIQNEEVLQYV